MIAANRLKKLRIDLEKTQQEMAEELYVEQSTYSRFENGNTKLSLAVIQIIIDKHNIQASEFFSLSPRKNPGLRCSPQVVLLTKNSDDSNK